MINHRHDQPASRRSSQTHTHSMNGSQRSFRYGKHAPMKPRQQKEYIPAPPPSLRNPKPETYRPKPEAPNPKTGHSKPETRNLKPETRNPKPETRNPKPEARNPRTRNPKPEIREPETRNPQHSTLNAHHLKLNTQHSTLNTQHSTRNTQHSTVSHSRRHSQVTLAREAAGQGEVVGRPVKAMLLDVPNLLPDEVRYR